MPDAIGATTDQDAGYPPIGTTFNQSTVFPDEVTMRPHSAMSADGKYLSYKATSIPWAHFFVLEAFLGIAYGGPGLVR